MRRFMVHLVTEIEFVDGDSVSDQVLGWSQRSGPCIATGNYEATYHGALIISHSSRNNDKAIEVRDWLAKNGWDDVFLDLDPERGIVAGQRWKDALQKAAQRCEMVLALVSAEWLASPWCKAEIDAARLMGKKVIVALIGIDKAQVPPDLNDEQWIDWTGDPDAHTRLR
jgi:hypothetical protein